ncbi:MAG: glutamate racemase [Pseudomonadota bacterium]
MAIGVFDSGLGGLTVLRALTRALPNQPFVYLGDNAAAPYGARTPEEVRALTVAGVEALFATGCRLVLLACNTASALALRPLQQDWLPNQAAGPDGVAPRVLGVFVPIVEVVTGRPWMAAHPPSEAPGGRRRILFFATPATVASGAFPREVAARATGLAVASIPCPGLVDALEAGDEAAAEAAVADAVATLGPDDADAEAAILGCTHYPLAYAAFRRALPDATAILSQPDITAASLARYLERRPEYESLWRPGGAPQLRCFTTGDPAHVGALAARFYGEPLPFQSWAASRA